MVVITMSNREPTLEKLYEILNCIIEEKHLQEEIQWLSEGDYGVACYEASLKKLKTAIVDAAKSCDQETFEKLKKTLETYVLPSSEKYKMNPRQYPTWINFMDAYKCFLNEQQKQKLTQYMDVYFNKDNKTASQKVKKFIGIYNDLLNRVPVPVWSWALKKPILTAYENENEKSKEKHKEEISASVSDSSKDTPTVSLKLT